MSPNVGADLGAEAYHDTRPMPALFAPAYHGAMGEIFRVDEHDIPWSDYEGVGESQARASIRYKPLTFPRTDVPSMQYIDYAPGHEDPVHSHDTGEVMIIIAGSLQLGEMTSGPGSAVYVPRGTDYAIRAGNEGVRYFRIVVP